MVRSCMPTAAFSPISAVSRSKSDSRKATMDVPSWLFFYRSGETRTRGLLLPNLSRMLFLLVYSGFLVISYLFYLLFDALISAVSGCSPEPSVVIYVVKNASRPVSGEDSPVPDGKRFAFQIICIVTLSRVLCKWFLREVRQKLSCYR